MTVLIISTLADDHVNAVMSCLTSHECRVELLDLAEFPQRLALSMSFRNGMRYLHLDRQGCGKLDFDRIRSVWWRRPQAFRLPAALANPVHQRFALSESATAFQGLYQSVSARWINPPLRDLAASHKPWQLTMAQEVGLEIPDTLMTNDPEAARAFCDACDGDVVYKQFLALADAWRETRRINAEGIRSDENLRLCPVIFQRRIAAVADLRVIVVGNAIFAASVAVDQLAYDVDVRMNIHAPYVPHTLPRSIEKLLLELMRRLDLVYGAIDMRQTEDGRYVFLEINPAGEFLYVERATGQPIAATLAHCLATL
jgi:hypothetical protein